MTPAEDSLAARLGRIENVGIITADFHHCWTAGLKPPPDEPSRPNNLVRLVEREIKDKDGRTFTFQRRGYTTRTTPGVGTTFGTDKLTDLQGVARVIGVTQASVTVRYERSIK